MKIGFLIINYYPYSGGAENVFRNMAEGLAKRHEVHILPAMGEIGLSREKRRSKE